MPTAFHLRNGVWHNFMASEGDTFKAETLGLLSLEHAAALAERSAGRYALIKYLVDQFRCEGPLWQHSVLPYLRPSAVFTTNYDTLIEDGWDLHSSSDGIGRYRTYYRDESPDQDSSIPLYKPHGSVKQAHAAVGEGGLVITQFDYIEMVNTRRSALSKCLDSLKNACVLFVGYSFQDLDIASTLSDMRNPSSRRSIPWYAVFPRNDANVRGMYEDRYGVRQIARTFLDFLADLDDRVDFINAAWKYSRISDIQGIVKPL
jgi:hypothetical protein